MSGFTSTFSKEIEPQRHRGTEKTKAKKDGRAERARLGRLRERLDVGQLVDDLAENAEDERLVVVADFAREPVALREVEDRNQQAIENLFRRTFLRLRFRDYTRIA